MAKSKRNRVVPLTKTKKNKLLDKKGPFIKKVHSYLEEYKYCYVFSYKNMSALPMQSLRSYFDDSKFLLGKTKVMQVALGRNEEESFKENTHLLSPLIRGNSALFFTNKEPDYILE